MAILTAVSLAMGTMTGLGTTALAAEEAGGPGVTLPLTDEDVTLKIWLPSVTGVLSVWGEYSEVPFFKELEARTGVHLEFETCVYGEEQTAFNLMIASEELPDIICFPNYYPDGLDAAIDDGYYLDLTPYLDTYLANYNALRTTNSTWKMDSVTDSGRAAAVYILYEETQGAWGGLQIRQDWLDDLGLDTPATYDELETVLTAFKEEKNAYAPLALCAHGNYWYGEMSAGFGVTDAFMNVDGTAVAGFATDAWREYLTLMNDWYEKGLIDPGFMSDSAWQVDTELVTTGASGVWWGMYTMASAYEATDENMVVSALASPKLNAEDTLHLRMADSPDGIGVSIAADCEYPEIAMQLIDYLYTEEGALFANYGIEGESFYYDENGDIQLTEKVLNKEDGLGLLSYAMLPDKIPSYYDYTRELFTTPRKRRRFLRHLELGRPSG